jgi:Chaperone of endosialidase
LAGEKEQPSPTNNIEIGNVGVSGESNHIRIGTKGTHTNTFIACIYGVTVASAVGVVIDVNGHLGTVTSSARFKEAIKPMDEASEASLGLKPVTFRYKEEIVRQRRKTLRPRTRA